MPEQRPVDLTSCDREPIHVPGAIQPHGALLALRGAAVAQVSDNVEAILGLPVAEVLGRPLAEVIDAPSAAAVAAALAGDRLQEENPLRVSARGRSFDGIVHRHQGAAILELEPRAASQDPGLHHPLRRALIALQNAQTLAQLCGVAVQEVRRLTGFERVILYRFDESGHGSVEAEDKEPALDPYLGLHYPASDIPLQARQLYLQNWLRIIPDARYTPARLVPALRPETGAPLDLSFSVLRSVSPIHLEYMANMGVRAAMSISLIVQDRLWGLISCANHSGPRLVPYELRSTCEVLGRLASQQISAVAARETAVLRAGRQSAVQRLVAAMRAADADAPLLETLLGEGEDLCSVAVASGAAVVRGGEAWTCGRTPPPERVVAIARFLDTQEEPFATAALPALLPAAEAVRGLASGVLSFSLPGAPRGRLLWFRPEMIQTVTWGGDPRKPVATDPSLRLRPRTSFEAWKEEVRSRSLPWTTTDLETAQDLRRYAVEIDLGRQVLREQRAVRARDDLVAVVSHDLKNPLGLIATQAGLSLRILTADDEASRRLRGGLERIQRAVERMSALIHDLLDLAKIEAGRFALQRSPEDMRDMLEEALLILRPLAEGKRISVEHQISGAPSVRADRERIYQVFSNLVGNAVKFTPEGGSIRVRAGVEGGAVVVAVQDSGPGVPADQVPHLFERYWQARRDARDGSGLGLFIAKGIVEAHGGQIWVVSRPGEGATFSFSLPLA